MSQKYFPSASEGNFSTIQQGKFVHIDKGLSPSSVCLRKDYVVFYFFQFVQLVWFNLCQLFNAVIWLVNLSKCLTNAEEGSASVAIGKVSGQYHLHKSSVLFRIWLRDTPSKILTFLMHYALIFILKWTRKSTTMGIILLLKWMITIQGNQNTCGLHQIAIARFVLLQKWRVWHTNEW